MDDNEFNFAIQDKNGRFRLPQCTVFLGDNGTGKTNLLKVIANLLPEREKVENVNNDGPIADMHVSLAINDNTGKPEKE
jgi:ABC-type multidrug transport system ATPase subunit